MHHSFIDKYSDRDSILHRFDPRLKVLCAITAIICILSTPTALASYLLFYAALILTIWLLSRLPFTHLLTRLGITLPFIALIALGTIFSNGETLPIHRYLIIIAKSALAITILTLLASTTRFPNLLKALEWYRMPKIILSLLAFLYRYIFILIDEFERISIGRKSRQFTKNLKTAWQSRAWTIGTLFLRSFERSERIYAAMLARGFSGEIRTLPMKYRINTIQIANGIVFVIICIAIRSMPYIANFWRN